MFTEPFRSFNAKLNKCKYSVNASYKMTEALKTTPFMSVMVVCAEAGIRAVARIERSKVRRIEGVVFRSKVGMCSLTFLRLGS